MIKSEKGQAVVELALVVPILLLLIFGMIDFGRIIHTYMTLEHVSRESARVASVGADDTEIMNKAYEALGSLNSNNITIQISPGTGRIRGSYVTVTTTYPIDIYTPLLSAIVPDPFEVTSETVMRVE